MRQVLLWLGAFGVAAPLLAQSTIPPFEESVVVTAAVENQEQDEVTATVAVILEEEIEARQATEVLQLLSTVPGLDVVQSGSPGKATSLFTRGTNSNHTLVLWSGIELNDPVFGGFDWAFLPTDGIGRVEVVRGPYSALYGGAAVGGVVQVLPGGSLGNRLRLEGGSDGYGRAGLATSFAAGPVRFVVNGHLRTGDGQLDNDGYDGEEISLRADWALGGTSNLGLIVRANDSEAGVPYDFFGNPTADRTQTGEHRMIAVPFAWQGDAWSVQAHVARHESEILLRDPDDPFAASDTLGEAQVARAVATRSLGDWSISVGTDWEEVEATTVSTFGPGLDEDSQDTWSVFSELRWNRGAWGADLGLRRDDNSQFGAATTVRGGLVYRVDDGMRLRASYGEGFRPPALGDLLFPGFGNADLQPEESRSAELAWELERGAWSLLLAGFGTDLENLIVFDFTTFLPQNIGAAEIRGVEGQAAYAFGRSLLRWNATWLDTEDLSTGEPLLRRPEWSSSLTLLYRAGDWTADLVGRYVGERLDLESLELPSYSTLETGVSWAVSDTFAPYGRLVNLLDEEYEEAAGFPAPGRTVVGGLAVRF